MTLRSLGLKDFSPRKLEAPILGEYKEWEMVIFGKLSYPEKQRS